MSARCQNPLPLERVSGYLLGDLDEADERDVEQHLFGCAACTAAAEKIHAFTAGVAAIVPPVIRAEHVQRLRDGGKRILETEVHPGDNPEVFFAADLDLAVHRLVTPLGDAERIDVEMFGETPGPIGRLEAVPFDAASGAVFIACQHHYRQMGFSDDMRFRVVAVSAGSRRVLGEYGVRHRWPL